MTVGKTTRFIILLGILLPSVGFAQSPSPLINQLARQMALKNKLKEDPGAIREEFKQNPLKLPAQKNKHLLHVFSKAYTAQRLITDFKASLEQKMTDQYRPEVSKWLHKPSTQAVVNAQQDNFTLQGKRKRVVAMYEIEQHPPSAERMHLFAALSDTTKARQTFVESNIIILRSVIRSIGYVSQKHQFNKTQRMIIIRSFRKQMLSELPKQEEERLAVMYHTVKTQSLKDYLSFFETDTGQWLSKAINQSMQAAYKAGAKRFLQAMKGT